MEKKYSNKSLIDKLGVAPGARVALLGIADPDLLKQLRSRSGDIYEGRLKKETAAIFLAADDIKTLDRLTHLRLRIKSNGTIWVVSLKGKQVRIKDVDIISAALKAALVDVKVVAFPPHTPR